MQLLAAHLDLVVCPACHGRLALAAQTIDCLGCGRRYPIVDGLPVLIVSRARLPPPSAPERDKPGPNDTTC